MGKDFARLWTATALSNLADGFLTVAVGLLAVRLTDDPLLVALTTTMASLPWVLASIPAGALADRTNRATVMAVANGLRAAVAIAIAILVGTDNLSMLTLYASIVLVGLFEPLYDNATDALIPALAGRENLEKANMRIQGAQMVAQTFIAVPVAAFVFAAVSFAPMVVAGLAYALTAVVALTLRRAAMRDTPIHVPGVPGPSFHEDLGEGLRFIRSSSVLGRLLAVTTVVAGAVAFAQAALVLYIIKILGVPERFFGLFSVAMALGGLAGMALAAPVARRLGRLRSLSWTIAMLAASIALMGFASEPVIGAVSLFSMALAAATWNVVAITARQSITPDRLMGRVQGYARTILVVATLSAGPAGGLVARIDMRAPFWVAASVLIVTAIVSVFLLPRKDDISFAVPATLIEAP